MEKLNYDQLDQIQGGGALGCAAGIAGMAATIGLAFTGVGTAAAAGVIIGWWTSGVSIAVSCADLLGE